MIHVLTSQDQAERIVRDRGVSIYPDESALVRDTFGDVYEVNRYGMCECLHGQVRCEHSRAASMQKAANVALERMYFDAGRAV